MKKYLFIALALLLAACEKLFLDNDASKEKDANVILRMSQFEQTAFDNGGNRSATRAAVDITELCSRLNIAIFDVDSTKVKSVSQKEGDASFGTVALKLATGSYRLVVIAHNCDGSATITSEEKVSFPNNKVTDTFYYYGNLEVNDSVKTYDLTLTRAVAMFRLVLTDEAMPSSVSKLKFYYTGGSSTFSPKDGYGCVNSRQTEVRTVAADGVYAIYTLIQLFCAALAFSALCRSLGQKDELTVFTGSLVYAFSGFALFTAAKHVYFVTYLVLALPLLLLGC